MTILTPPANQNFLGKNGFQFNIAHLPNTSFFVQECNIPGMTIDPVFIGNPLVSLPYSGDHVQHEELTITFKMDEDLGAYIDIYKWMYGLGFPENSEQYANLAAQAIWTGKGLVSDATLMILDAKKRPNYKIIFNNAFPVSLSTIQLSTSGPEGGAEFITADCSFRYDTFDIQRVKAGSSEWVMNQGT